ncbi:MAG: TrmB family transcriptional regulator [Thermoplasmata archaeon]|nr:TrmB family transcriptional regulator [Thermoplasmata archaeon]
MLDIGKELNLEAEYKNVLRTLRSIGLSGYEAKTYIALVAHGVGDAETIASTAKIPRTSSYKALQSLSKKGFAISTRGRPKIYKPEPPDRVRDRLLGEVSDTFDKLALIHEILKEKGEPQLVYTITGKSKVIEKIGELLDGSTKTFMLSTPSFSELRDSLTKKLEKASKRGIRTMLITDPLQRALKAKNIEVIKRKGLIATDVISDGERALIASHDLAACGYTDNASLAEHLEGFLKILMVH